MNYRLLGYCEKKWDDNYYIFTKKRIGNGMNVLEINESGREILSMMKEQRTIDEIIGGLLKEYALGDEMRNVISNDVFEFVQSLVEFGILQIENDAIVNSKEKEGTLITVDDGLKKYQMLQKFYAEKHLPYKFFIELTYNCNLKCRHCYKTEDVADAKQVPLYLKKDIVFSILDQMEELDVIEVYLTGGEVFLHPNIVEIIEYAAKKNFRLIILTNGNALENDTFLNKIKDLEIYDIRISIYGNEEFHDAMTRVKGSFKKTLTALRKIKKEMGIGTAVYVITKENFECHKELIEILEDEKINYSLNTHITPTSYGELFPLKFRITVEQYEELHQKYKMPLSGTGCSAGMSRFRITPKGDVNPCELIRNATFGNVYVDSIQSIIEGEKRKEFVKFYSSMVEQHKCNSCDLQANCSFCPALFLLENDDYNIPSNYLCKMTSVKRRFAMGERK